MGGWTLTLVLWATLPLVAAAQADCISYDDHLHWTGLGAALDDTAHAVVVAGEYAYVAAGTIGLVVVDVATNTALAIVAQLPLPGRAVEVTVADDLVLVAAGEAGLQIVDVSQPAAPHLLGGIATPGVALDVAASGAHAFVAAGGAGLAVVDFSTPTEPELVGGAGTAWGTARGIALAGDRAYVAHGYWGVFAVDIFNPDQPLLLDGIDIPGWGYTEAVDIAVVGENLVVALNDFFGPTPMDLFPHTTLAVLGREPLTDPFPQGRLLIGDDAPGRLVLHGGLVYGAGETVDVYCVDVTNPLEPVLAGRAAVPGAATGVGVGGPLALVGTADAGLQSIDTSVPNSPPTVASLRVNGDLYNPSAALALTVEGDLVYLVYRQEEFTFYWSGALGVFDVSDPTAPQALFRGLSWTPDTDGIFIAHDIEVAQGHLFISLNNEVNNGLRLVDATDPHAPVDLGWVPGVASRDVFVFGRYAYAIEQEDYLRVLDLVDPAAPVLVNSLDVGGGEAVVQCPGGICVLQRSGDDGSLQLLNIDDPVNPLPTIAIPLAGGWPVAGVRMARDRFMVADRNRGLLIYDLTPPVVPELLGEQLLPGELQNIAGYGLIILVAAGTAGMQAVNLSDVGAPSPAGSLPFAHARDAVRVGDKIYIAADDELVVAYLDCRDILTVEAGPEGPPPAARIVGNHPNPFNPRTAVRFELPHAQSVSLKVFDVAGQRIATIADRTFAAGTHEVVWDARDAAGRELPSGAYVVVLEGEGGRQARKVMLLQ